MATETKLAATNNNGKKGRVMGARLRSWRPELPDHRDRIFQIGSSVLPEFINPLGVAAGVRIHDQGMTSSCTGHAGSTLVETALKLKGDAGQLSRLFPYYLAREMIGEAHLDMGAYNRDIIKSFVNFGVPKETNWRFTSANILKKPSATAVKAATAFKTQYDGRLSYEKCLGLDAVLQAIGIGCPVMFGFLAYDKIFDLTAKNDVYTMPQEGEYPIGGHAVVADGFNLTDRMITVANSWGTTWGKRGYFRMPFEWFTDPRRLVDDCWTLRVSESNVEGE